jgi:hypothetical protein
MAMYVAHGFQGVAGSEADRVVVEASVGPTHYWRVPNKEFCYKSVKFGHLDVEAQAGGCCEL